MIAEVIVDVPAGPVDRPFDYEIPEDLEQVIEMGSRVEVPFGSRKLLGYVVGLKHQSTHQRLKKIRQVKDVQPTLTKELVQIGLRMADEYLCYPITAFHAMVPAVLKGKYKKWIFLHPKISETGRVQLSEQYPELWKVLQEEGGCLWEKALDLPNITRFRLQQLLKDQQIWVKEEVSDRTTRQKIRWVKAPDPDQLTKVLAEISPRKKQQKKILQFFVEEQTEIPLATLLKRLKTTRSTVKACVDQNWLVWEDRITYRDPFQDQTFTTTQPLKLTAEQATAFQAILEPIHQERHESILLHGVTGSGKTELYLQSIDKVLKKGKEAIVLVPEISLTPQMVRRFKERLGSKVAVLHSGLSSGERFDEWQKIRTGECQVVIGARSAIFAPFQNLGLIIIDEEHESSYKQEENPKYHARTIAKWRAENHQAVLLLGSATPAVESYFLARTHRYRWLPLRERVNQLPYPKVHVVDMRKELQSGNRSMFSRLLQEKLVQCVSQGEQAVLFLNRRGFSTFVICRECGEALLCPKCDISLTYHQSNQTVRCHYCGYAERLPDECPECGSVHIRHFGVGTQRVEDELQKQFPDLRVIRMDVDTTSRKGAHQKLLSAFGEGEADVLLGTQMIAKGLDFPKVTMVGVITADTILHLSDFRAAERTFQLLTQVGGRAGRRDQPGTVVIQTYHEDHYSIQMAAHYQIASFYKQELSLRKKHFYPPFCGIFHLLLTHPDREVLFRVGQNIAVQLKDSLSQTCEILGPAPAMIPRIKNVYRLQIMIKSQETEYIQQKVKDQLRLISSHYQGQGVRVSISREGTLIS